MQFLTFDVNLIYICDKSDDYETWEYASCEHNNVLGMSLSIKRRKPELTCFNGAEFNRTVQKQNCEKCEISVSLTPLMYSLIESNKSFRHI